MKSWCSLKGPISSKQLHGQTMEATFLFESSSFKVHHCQVPLTPQLLSDTIASVICDLRSLCFKVFKKSLHIENKWKSFGTVPRFQTSLSLKISHYSRPNQQLFSSIETFLSLDCVTEFWVSIVPELLWGGRKDLVMSDIHFLETSNFGSHVSTFRYICYISNIWVQHFFGLADSVILRYCQPASHPLPNKFVQVKNKRRNEEEITGGPHWYQYCFISYNSL